MTQSRCLIYAGGWSRRRLCGARRRRGQAIVCSVAHRDDPSPLYCRCGGLVAPEMPPDKQAVLRDVAKPHAGLLGGVRSLDARRRLAAKLLAGCLPRECHQWDHDDADLPAENAASDRWNVSVDVRSRGTCS